MWPKTARQASIHLLPSCGVDTNESLRQRALRLITLGCSQKILAAKMGMQASTLSRWLNQKEDVAPVSVTALDGFNAYVAELRAALVEDPISSPGVSELNTPTGKPARASGQADGHTLAEPAGDGHRHPIPSAPVPRRGNLRAQVEREVLALESRRVLPTTRTGTPRQSPAAAHQKTPVAGARGRKPRR